MSIEHNYYSFQLNLYQEYKHIYNLSDATNMSMRVRRQAGSICRLVREVTIKKSIFISFDERLTTNYNNNDQ